MPNVRRESLPAELASRQQSSTICSASYMPFDPEERALWGTMNYVASLTSLDKGAAFAGNNHCTHPERACAGSIRGVGNIGRSPLRVRGECRYASVHGQPTLHAHRQGAC